MADVTNTQNVIISSVITLGASIHSQMQQTQQQILAPLIQAANGEES